MPDIYLDVDSNITVPVNILPLLDDTDFKSCETALAYNAAGMDLVWNFITTNGTITQTAVTPTTGGDYDWSHVGDGIYKIELPASGGASANNDAEGFGWFSGFITGVLPWRGPVIGFRAAGLNNALIDSPWSTTRGLAGTALPDAAADAAGGLPISDAGGLDLDAQIKTDIDAIRAKTDNLPADPADDSDLDSAIAAVKAVADAILEDTGSTIPNLLGIYWIDIGSLQADLTSILTDTGTTLPAAIAAIEGGSGATPQEIWEYEERTLTEGAAAEVDEVALGQAIWTYGSRTLTLTPTQLQAFATSGIITQTRGNDWTLTFTGLTFSGTNMQFAIKADRDQADAAANLLIDETGLLYLNGSFPEYLLSSATMTYDAGTLTITVKAAITAQLDPGIYHYGIQDISPAGLVNESYIGQFTITADVIRGTT